MDTKCLNCIKRLRTKSNWCLARGTCVSNITDSDTCKHFRDFAIYTIEDALAYESGKISKEEILAKQEADKHKYPTHEEIKLFNDENAAKLECAVEDDKIEGGVGNPIDITKCTVAELKELAKAQGKKGYSNMNKTQLIELVKGI